MPFFPKSYADIVQRLRVPSGILLAMGFVLLAEPTQASLIANFPICLAGLALRAWAAGHLRKNQTLTTSGPYAWVRNPLYIGTLITAAGCTSAARRFELDIAALVLFVFIYGAVMEQEEQHLSKLFPEFADYAHRVHQLLPKPPRERSEQRFSWAVYLRNKEQKALYGFLSVYGFLVAKSMW